MSSDDWKVGDLALCIESGLRTREGTVYTVEAVHPASLMLGGWFNPGPGALLAFIGMPTPADMWSSEYRFRKIRPDEHRACEEEFVTLLESFKPKVDASLTDFVVVVSDDGIARVSG